MEFKLSEAQVQIIDSVDSWQEAIKIASQPLLDLGYIKEEYVKEMIATTSELNFYIVIMPLVAMPHSRGDGVVFKNSFSVLKLREQVFFSEGDSGEDPVTIVIPLACVDAASHMKMLMSISGVLSDTEKMDILFKSEDHTEIVKLFEGE